MPAIPSSAEPKPASAAAGELTSRTKQLSASSSSVELKPDVQILQKQISEQQIIIQKYARLIQKLRDGKENSKVAVQNVSSGYGIGYFRSVVPKEKPAETKEAQNTGKELDDSEESLKNIIAKQQFRMKGQLIVLKRLNSNAHKTPAVKEESSLPKCRHSLTEKLPLCAHSSRKTVSTSTIPKPLEEPKPLDRLWWKHGM